MARIRREQSAARVATTTVEPGQSSAMTSVNGLTMSGKRDLKFNEKKRTKNEKVIENGTTGTSVSTTDMIQMEGKFALIKFKFK